LRLRRDWLFGTLDVLSRPAHEFCAAFAKLHALDISKSVAEHGMRPWLAKTLDTAAAVIAGALNVLGVRRVVITGIIPNYHPPCFECFDESFARGILWGTSPQVENRDEGTPGVEMLDSWAAGPH